jgi:DEAD/DEAH box helicase domain-containing protein
VIPLADSIYLDLETQRTALDVGGWYPDKMGVSVAVVLVANRLRIFTEQDIDQLLPILESAGCVVGWNIKAFDFKVLGGGRGVDLERVRCLDLMEEMEKTTGQRLMLSSVSAATLGIEPNTDGLEMVKLWKAGRVEKVIEGCCNGVLTIKALHEYGLLHSEIFFRPRNGKRRVKIAANWKTGNASSKGRLSLAWRATSTP